MNAENTEPTVTDLLLARSDDGNPGLKFDECRWSWAEHIRECAVRAAALSELRTRDQPFHIGVLLDNRPEFSFLLGGCALAGAVLVGLNATRRGQALARDVRIADCQLVLTERRYAGLLDDLDLGAATGRVLDVHGPQWTALLRQHADARLDPVPAAREDLLMLIFTSGTSGEPKAVRCTHGKIAGPGVLLADRFGLDSTDTAYVAMPMFHSNAIMAGWSVGLAAGAAIALRPRFSASGFLPDVRRFGATYANYVGTPLSYVLATPQRPDDADNPLRLVYGNEGAPADLDRFAERFGCRVIDAFGSTEGGIAIARTPDTPQGSLGPLPPEVRIVHPETGQPCPAAEFDDSGKPANPEQAIGELVNTAGAGAFAGYYGDEQATEQRLRSGWYYSGDLAYADARGYCYFAGRAGDWLRVQGENIGAEPIERVLLRHPDIAEAAVYGLPGEQVGDRVMAALVLRPGASFDPGLFARFLTEQSDLGPKELPEFVRITTALPRTATHKVLKRELADRGTQGPEPVWRADPRHRRDNGELRYHLVGEHG